MSPVTTACGVPKYFRIARGRYANFRQKDSRRSCRRRRHPIQIGATKASAMRTRTLPTIAAAIATLTASIYGAQSTWTARAHRAHSVRRGCALRATLVSRIRRIRAERQALLTGRDGDRHPGSYAVLDPVEQQRRPGRSDWESAPTGIVLPSPSTRVVRAAQAMAGLRHDEEAARSDRPSRGPSCRGPTGSNRAARRARRACRWCRS